MPAFAFVMLGCPYVYNTRCSAYPAKLRVLASCAPKFILRRKETKQYFDWTWPVCVETFHAHHQLLHASTSSC